MVENEILAATHTHLCYACFPIPLPLSPLYIQLTFSFSYHTYTKTPPHFPHLTEKGERREETKI